jgi:hypothetical protein
VNLVTRWQALEYITSQNMDRRAFASLNCITVVPGAVGAWRKDLLVEAVVFRLTRWRRSGSDAADQAAWLHDWLRRDGDRVDEAPHNLRSLAKQRFRWAYGTLQCMWKHRDALLRPRYGALGFVAMPNVWNLSDPVSADLAGEGSDVDLRAVSSRDRSLATRA